MKLSENSKYEAVTDLRHSSFSSGLRKTLFLQ